MQARLTNHSSSRQSAGSDPWEIDRPETPHQDGRAHHLRPPKVRTVTPSFHLPVSLAEKLCEPGKSNRLYAQLLEPVGGNPIRCNALAHATVNERRTHISRHTVNVKLNLGKQLVRRKTSPVVSVFSVPVESGAADQWWTDTTKRKAPRSRTFARLTHQARTLAGTEK